MLAVVIALLSIAAPHHHVQHHKQHKHKSIHRTVIDKFDLCVANNETGSPGSVSFGTIHWNYTPSQNEGLYEGGYSWLNSTWLSQGGGRYAQHAYEASPKEQSIIFNRWSRLTPGAWPATIPPCLYLR